GETAAALGDPGSTAPTAPDADREPGDASPKVPGEAAAPQIANVTPTPRQAETPTAGGDNRLLLFLGSIAVPFLGLTVIGAIELARRREPTYD
ncbi:MAG: hypothetical protein DRI30_02935, partial [Chloroflexi bacterium]